MGRCLKGILQQFGAGGVGALLLLDNQFVFLAVKTGLVLDVDSVAVVGAVAEPAGADLGQAGSGRDQVKAA
ncbi:MAG: hypothetical protein SGI77_04015 [Pirellulaceae bacterium]|nr:hypothetical protein [Pirellulaceae bacterium]